MAELGTSFAEALAAKDVDRLRELMHPEIDFRGLTPNRSWDASGPDAVISDVLEHWFEESDRIVQLLSVETEMVADRERVGYRLMVDNDDGRFVVEQQAYMSERDGQIGWMRVVCSGFRPLTVPTR